MSHFRYYKRTFLAHAASNTNSYVIAEVESSEAGTYRLGSNMLTIADCHKQIELEFSLESARARRAHTLRETGGAAADPMGIRWRRLVSDTVVAMMLRLRYSNGKIATRRRQSVTELQSPDQLSRSPRRPQPPVPA